ncbi:MAG: AAA family ATPase [Oscillospiraceae bacterium]|nr:AAA family ATPase [Oscillospiraceae bacterium]
MSGQSAPAQGGELTMWSAAQQSVIGAMMLDESCCGEVFQTTTAEMFSDGALRHIYEAARRVWLEKRKVDPVLVADACGSDSYTPVIAECMRLTPTVANVEEYCGLLAKCLRLSTYRQAAYALLDAQTAEAAGEIWQKLGKELMATKKRRAVRYADMLEDFMDRMNDLTPPDFIDWGMPELNEALTVTHGRFVVIGAESSVGKTAFALQLARSMAKTGKKVGFFSLETSAPDAADRFIANAADVPLPAIKHRRMSEQDFVRATREAEAMYEAQLDLIEAAGYSAAEIEEDTVAGGYEVIFVDYVQIVQNAADDVTRQVRAVSIALHNLAIRLHCTVVALSQVTPPEKSKVTGQRRSLSMWDLRESRQLTQDAEAILMMELSDHNDYSSNRVLTIAKNKDGPCGRMTLHFDAKHMRFSYVPPYEDPPITDARERNAKMDRNRAARQEKERRKAGIDGQASFHELEPDEGGELPF